MRLCTVTKHTSVAPTPQTAWTDDDAPQGYMVLTSKGQQLIIVHAGTEKGLIPGALLILKSNQKTGDCYKEMNNSQFTTKLRFRG